MRNPSLLPGLHSQGLAAALARHAPEALVEVPLQRGERGVDHPVRGAERTVVLPRDARGGTLAQDAAAGPSGEA